MAYRTRTEVELRRFTTVKLRLTTQIHETGMESFNETATLTVDTGAATVHTYMTADQCREFAHGLLDAAADLDRIAISMAPPAVVPAQEVA